MEKDRVSEKYTKMFGETIKYRSVVTRYIIGPDGKRIMIWDKPVTQLLNQEKEI